MNLVDANILLYAYDSSSRLHERAREWLEREFSGGQPVALAWNVVLAFIRIATNPRALVHPLSLPEVCTIVSSWLDQPSLVVLSPGERHWELLQSLLQTSQARGPLAMDAHLAALALEHGAAVATNDRDFARFAQVRVLYPLDEG